MSINFVDEDLSFRPSASAFHMVTGTEQQKFSAGLHYEEGNTEDSQELYDAYEGIPKEIKGS